MTELSKEYFDQALKNLASKDDLKPLATLQDVREAVEELARTTNSGFEDVQRRLDVTERVQKIEAAPEHNFSKLENYLQPVGQLYNATLVDPFLWISATNLPQGF